MNAQRSTLKEKIMLPTYEALLQPNGQLQFVDLPAEMSRLPRHVLVTFTGEAVGTVAAPGGQSPGDPAPTDWRAHVGLLRDSPHWQGDPLAVQQDMRREWD
jgi:hypothetical protein